jgi:hypothetical protein
MASADTKNLRLEKVEDPGFGFHEAIREQKFDNEWIIILAVHECDSSIVLVRIPSKVEQFEQATFV